MASNMESGFTTTLAAKLGAADVEMIVATAPTVTSGRLFLKSGSTKEWISYTGVSGTILTGLTRNLSKTADPSTGGTGLSRLAGTTITIVAMHDQLFDRTDTGAVTLPGAYTFTGENTVTNKLIVSGANGEIDMSASKKTLGLPQLTTTERLAITPKNGDLVYDTDIGENYQYKGGARVTIDTGTPIANASETVAGKVQIATASEIAAGTRIGTTGAILAISPDNLGEALKTTKKVYTAGEDITVGDSLCSIQLLKTSTPNQGVLFGYDTTLEKISFKYISSGGLLSSLSVYLRKSGSPVDNLQIRIETDNAGDPSGTLVDGDAIATISGSTLSTSNVLYSLNFTNPFVIPEGNYHIVFTRSGSLSTSNFFYLGTVFDGAIEPLNPIYMLQSGVWQIVPGQSEFNEPSFYIDYTLSTFKTDGSDTRKINFIGFADTTATTGNDVVVNLTYDDNQSGLTIGDTLFLSDTPGAVANTPGTNSVAVGFADSTTSIQITNKKGGGRIAKGTGTGTITTGFYPKQVIYSDTGNTSCYLDEAAVSNKTQSGFTLSSTYDWVAFG